MLPCFGPYHPTSAFERLLKGSLLMLQVSQKQAARSAELARHQPDKTAKWLQPATAQQQQRRPSEVLDSPPDQRQSRQHQPQQAQHAQHVPEDQERNSSSLQGGASAGSIGTGLSGAGRGERSTGRAGVAAALAAGTSFAHDGASPPPQASCAESQLQPAQACGGGFTSLAAHE